MNPGGGLGRQLHLTRRKDPMRRLVIHRGQRELLEVIDALDAPGRRSGRLNGRKQKRDQHRDDRDDDQSSINVKPREPRDRTFIEAILLILEELYFPSSTILICLGSSTRIRTWSFSRITFPVTRSFFPL